MLLCAVAALRWVRRPRYLRGRRERRLKIRTVVVSIFIGFRFGHFGANPVKASDETRATSEKDPRGKNQDKDQRGQNRHLRGPACSKHPRIYLDFFED